jgi:signal transduction histidine kinase/ActR/RegA family two-component response regulator
VRAFLDRFMPDDALRDPESERKARFALGLTFVCIPLGVLYALHLYAVLREPVRAPLSALVLGWPVVSAISVALLRRGVRLQVCLHLVLGYLLLLCSALGYFLGGAHGPLPFSLVIIPAVSVLAGSLRSGLVCFAVCQLIYAGFAWMVAHGHDVRVPPRPVLANLWFGGACGLFVTTFAVVLVFDRAKEEALRVLELTHRALLTARDHARAASQCKSSFLARVGQDLRTPMAQVIEATEELTTRSAGDAVAAGPLDSIARNARHLMQTIDRIVDLSQMESDRLAIEQVSCDPRALAGEVVAGLREAAAQRGMAVRVECADDAPARMITDPARLRQILVNFVRNAVLFSEARALCVALRSVHDAEPRIRFEVRDDGVGIPADTLARIFEPFQQAGARAARRFGGTGLGLWSARRLCERMGGSISAESAPGAGSVFGVELPVHAFHGARSEPKASAVRPDAPDAVERARTPAALWNRIARRMVPVGREDDPRALHEARMVLALAVVPTPVVIPWAAMTAGLFEPPAGPALGLLLVATAPLLWSLTWLYRRTGSLVLACNVLAAYVFAMLTLIGYFNGGALSPSHYSLILIPAAAPVLGVRSAFVWTVLGILSCAVFYALERAGASPRDWMAPERVAMTAVSNAATLCALATGVIALFERTHVSAVEHAARANEELATARRVADEASRRQSDFLANMSHELRTPMTAILGYAEVLSEEWTESCMHARSLWTIQRNTRQLVSLVDDLVDLNRLHEGRIDPERIAFGPEELAQGAADLLRDRATAKALELSVRVQRPVPERVQGDPGRVRQVLVNLVGNAIKFTSTGSVEVRVSAGSDWIRYEVEDTGPGLAPEQLEALLRPLSQETDATEALAARAGLGLAVSRLLCRLLGGELGVHSTAGAGSCFFFQIPAVAAPLPRASADAARASEVSPALRGRVLLVEDSPDTQKLISHLLRKAGASVTLASNGQEGLDQIDASESRNEPFALVLMDLQMPVLDGYAAVRELRRRGSTLPVVALTAHALEEERLRCLEAGFDAFATKPIDRRALLALVQEWSREQKAGGT